MRKCCQARSRGQQAAEARNSVTLFGQLISQRKTDWFGGYADPIYDSAASKEELVMAADLGRKSEVSIEVFAWSVHLKCKAPGIAGVRDGGPIASQNIAML